MDNILIEEKVIFILDPTRRQLILHGRDTVTLILKVAYNDSVDFLYTHYHYNCDNPLKIGGKLDYAGFVHHPTGRIYDGSYILFRHQEEADTISLDTVKKETLDAINATLAACVDMKPVPVTMAAESTKDNERSGHEKYGAEREARRAFFAGKREIKYRPCVSLELSTDQIIQAVMHGDNFVTAWTDDYVLRKANQINERLWQISVSQQRLDALWNTPGTHHTTLAISGSIEADMKMVSLHLDKDGKQIVVKYEAFRLRSADTDDYSDWHMDAPGRRAFEKTYGQNARLFPSDIQRITYGKKTIYERKEGQT